MRYFTKEWYELCQEYSRAYGPKKTEWKKRLDAVSEAFRKDLAQQNLPEVLWKQFHFHDGEILDVQEGKNLVIRVNSPFTTYKKITFCNAAVKQDSIPVGAVWLYEELYRHALGYEAHILCESRLGLRNTKIICSEILFEEKSR